MMKAVETVANEALHKLHARDVEADRWLKLYEVAVNLLAEIARARVMCSPMCEATRDKIQRGETEHV
mgnify:FL=1